MVQGMVTYIFDFCRFCLQSILYLQHIQAYSLEANRDILASMNMYFGHSIPDIDYLDHREMVRRGLLVRLLVL